MLKQEAGPNDWLGSFQQSTYRNDWFSFLASTLICERQLTQIPANQTTKPEQSAQYHQPE